MIFLIRVPLHGRGNRIGEKADRSFSDPEDANGPYPEERRRDQGYVLLLSPVLLIWKTRGRAFRVTFLS